MIVWWRAHRKAVAGLVVPLVVGLGTHWALNLPAEWSVTLGALIAGPTVSAIPNTPPS